MFEAITCFLYIIKDHSGVGEGASLVPGGSVVKNPLAKAGDTGLIPDLGGFHMPWSKQARAPQLLSLHPKPQEPQLLGPRAATMKPAQLRACALQRQKPPQREACAQEQPHSPHPEKTHTATKTARSEYRYNDQKLTSSLLTPFLNKKKKSLGLSIEHF